MKNNKKLAPGAIVLLVSLLFISSCIDNDYDLDKGIDSSIKIGGDSLAIPIGSTSVLELRDFLDAEDIEFLMSLEDGKYEFKLSDSLIVDDLLSSLDTDNLKFDDQVFSLSTSVSFGDISVSDFKVPGFNIDEVIELNIPKVEIDKNIVPSIDLNEGFTVSFSDYSLDDNKLELSDLLQNVKRDGFLADVEPFASWVLPLNPETAFGPVTIEVLDENGDPLLIDINYSIEVPDGVTNIYQIDLEAGGNLELSVSMSNVAESIDNALFTPDFNIDPSDMFIFNNSTPLTGGKIVFNNNHTLNSSNNFKSTRTFIIDGFQNLPPAANNLIDLAKTIVIAGFIDAEGTIKENKIQDAKDIGLEISVDITGLKIKNMDLDVPAFTTSISGNSTFDIESNDIPDEVNTINRVYFDKGNAYADNTNIVIEIIPAGLPQMIQSDFVINNLTIDFPSEFVFGNLAVTSYNAPVNTPFDPVNGFKIEIDLSEIDMSGVPINGNSLLWNGQISYTGEVSFGGRMNSEDIDPLTNPVLSLESKSDIILDYASLTTNSINQEVTENSIAIDIDIDIAEQVSRLGVINMKDGSTIRIEIETPNLPLPLQADNVKIVFTDLFEFKSHPNYNSATYTYTINGAIPDYIELELEALHINQDLVDGKLTLQEYITIGGGVILESGVVNSTDIEALDQEKLTVRAIIPDLYIESTELELNSLEATYQDFTNIDLEIDDVPLEIEAVDSIILKAGSELDIEIEIRNMPNLGDSPLLADITLKFPDLLEFMPGVVNSENEMVISEQFVNGKLSKNAAIKKLNLNLSGLNGKLTIDEKVEFDVVVKVENPTVNSDDLNGEDIYVDVNVVLRGLEFEAVYGTFNIDFGDQLDIPSIELDDLPEQFRGDNVVLDIVNPVLSLRTKSNIGLPVDAELLISKYKDGLLQLDDQISVNFNLPKSDSPEQFLSNSYWISPSESGKPAEYNFVEKEVQKLFNPSPDSLKIEINPVINSAVQHYVNLFADYSLEVIYDIIIPLTFGKDFSITIEDVIEDIDMGFDDMDISTGELELIGLVTNSIPLDLELELKLMDANNNILSTPDTQKIFAGAPNGSSVESHLRIKIVDNIEVLNRLNKIELVFRATSNTTVAGTPLRVDNFVKAEFKVKLNGGINIKL